MPAQECLPAFILGSLDKKSNSLQQGRLPRGEHQQLMPDLKYDLREPDDRHNSAFAAWSAEARWLRTTARICRRSFSIRSFADPRAGDSTIMKGSVRTTRRRPRSTSCQSFRSRALRTDHYLQHDPAAIWSLRAVRSGLAQSLFFSPIIPPSAATILPSLHILLTLIRWRSGQTRTSSR